MLTEPYGFIITLCISTRPVKEIKSGWYLKLHRYSPSKMYVTVHVFMKVVKSKKSENENKKR